MILPICKLCGGALRSTQERHARETIQFDLSCRDCGTGGTVSVHPDGGIARRVGPAVDAREARRHRDRSRLVADGGAQLDEPNPRQKIIAAEIAVCEGNLDRAEEGLLAALSDLRRKRGDD